MKERIIQIMQKAGLNKSEFAEKIGVAVSLLSHIISGRNNPSLNVVMGIHKAYPGININWLLYGEGEMMASETAKNPEIPTDDQMVFNFSTDKPSTPAETGHKDAIKEEIRYIEKPAPKITEIRIFFDNGTYEVFKPDK